MGDEALVALTRRPRARRTSLSDDSAGDEPISTLQQAAGNRAVSQLLTAAPTRADTAAPVATPSAFDALRMRGQPGNGAMAAVLQRQPTDPPPRTKRKGVPKAPPTAPMEVRGDLPDIVSKVPGLISAINTVHYKTFKGSGYAHGATADEATFTADVKALTLFARDAVYRFASDGSLREVESNLSAPIDAAHPDDIPAPINPLPQTSIVAVVDAATNRKWQVFFRQNGALDLQPLATPISMPSSMADGLVVFAYAPASLASEDGGPQPGFKAKQDDKALKPDQQPDKPPKWADSQVDRLRRLLANQQGRDDVHGTGTGAQGEGPGGGGTDVDGMGTGKSGTGSGRNAKDTKGAGRGAKSAKVLDRDKPDKIGLYMGKKGPLLNVWKDGSKEALPLQPNESDHALQIRVEQAAARMRSTGKRLADSAGPMFVGGEGGGQPSADDLAEATKFTSNAPPYPSRIVMQGGSGADVSPKGWATTIAGADHNFDMILDWDAITFGQVNQVFARLQYISYYWQVVDVSREPIKDAEKDARAGARAAVKENEDNARHPGAFEGVRAKMYRDMQNESEGIKEDRPDFSLTDNPGQWAGKAAVLAAEGVSAAWTGIKSLVSAWITKMLEPLNRQDIRFENPGEYVVRVLANPIEATNKKTGDVTRRATSIAAFPVRVLEPQARGQEVNREEKTEIDNLTKALASAQALLAKNPDDPSIKAAVKMFEAKLGAKQTAAGRGTNERLKAEVDDFDREERALRHLIAWSQSHEKRAQGDLKGATDGLTGQDLAAAMRVLNDEGLLAEWQWENRLDDVQKARKETEKRLDTGTDWAKSKIRGGTSQIRPKVTFVSEENGAVVRMDMILGIHPDSAPGRPKWSLLDVTSHKTQGKYSGSSTKEGPAGHVEAIRNAFQEYADKAEYGRGTIAIDVPSNEATEGGGALPPSMLMKPGEFGRWKKRLDDLIEVASLVVPFAPEAAAAGAVIAAAGAVSAGYRLYDRASNDKLEADFETLSDIMGVLTPFIEGAAALSELKALRETSTGFVLKVVAEGGHFANEVMIPASIIHDINQVVADQTLGGPEKEAAVIGILGRAARDKLIQHLGAQSQRAREPAWTENEPHGQPRPATGHQGEEPNRPHEEDPTRTHGDESNKPHDEQPRQTPDERPREGESGGVGVGIGGGGGGHQGGGPPAAAAYEPGMPKGSMRGLKELADHYGIVIDVRPPNEFAGQRLAKGALAKPEMIKAKTITEADRMIGAPSGSIGLVGFFKPERPTMREGMTTLEWEAVVDRYQQRSAEYDTLHSEMTQLQKDGKIQIKDGVVYLEDPRGAKGDGKQYKAVAGDVDVYQITWADGRPMSQEAADTFAGVLRPWGIGVEHGAHLRWEPKTAKDRQIYGDIVKQHGPGGTPLLRFEPNQEPKRVNNETPITIQPGRGGSVDVVTDTGKAPRNGPTWGSAPRVIKKPGKKGGPGEEGGPGAPAGGVKPPAGEGDKAGRPRLNDENAPQEADHSGPKGTVGTDEPVRKGPSPNADIEAEPGRGPSRPKDVTFEKKPTGQFEFLETNAKKGASTSYIVRDRKSGKRYIFKPTAGEAAVPRAQERGIVKGDYAPRAKAGEIAAKSLGLETPHVELVVLQGRKGSLTEWVDKMSLADYALRDPDGFRAMQAEPEFKTAMAGVQALDYLINNVDRVQNLGNYLVELTPEGTFKSLTPIDHDLTFTSTTARANIPDYAGGLPREYSKDMREKLTKLDKNRAGFLDSIRPLVGDEAVEGVDRRLTELVNDMNEKQRRAALQGRE